ncbi:MAG: DoxX family protein [Burkholderiaceae bacterium]
MTKTTWIDRMLTSKPELGPLLLRVPVGLTFAAHGAQKLFGWFGGYGLTGTGEFFASIGLNPGVAMALLAGSAEFFGGLALALGLLVRPSAALLAFTMLVGIFSVHWSKGFFAAAGGYEYAMILMFASLALLASGAGRLGLDNRLAAGLRSRVRTGATVSA